MADDWDLEELTDRWQDAWWKAGLHLAEHSDDGRPTYFLHFAYPGISGYLHVGHMRGFTYADVLTRYKRQTGHNVLFPAGFHASGIPAVAFAKEVERGEKTEYLRQNGYEGPLEPLTDPEGVVEYFAHVYTQDYWKKFGFLIDDRRNCTTIDPGYKRFIQWQFRQLDKRGWLVEKPHYAPFCPVSGPVAVDKSETDLKTGGSAEVIEYTTIGFHLSAGGVWEEPLVIPCATLRPETVYGVTNVWVHPEATYHVVRVWQDGAVGDDDPSEHWLASEQGCRRLEGQFERAEATGKHIRGEHLVGELVTVPVVGRQVPIVAGTFVDPQIATGIVMSVPGHAPFDFAAYRDEGLLEKLGEPPQIIDVEGYDGLPARIACERHGVVTQGDKLPLEEATHHVYQDEFNHGVLNALCGPHEGQRVRVAKDAIRAEMLDAGQARIVRQFSEPVVSRAGEDVEIRRIPDQAFIRYSDPEWTALAKSHVPAMSIQPERYKEELPNVLDWFGDRACVRRGAWLGTEYPFKEGWIVEPIADSTFYPWFYTISLYVNDGRLKVDELDDAFFDHVLLGKGEARSPVWSEVRRDVLYWGPVDVNLGGKEHQTVHFPVYVMMMCGLMEKPQWPRGIFVNWWVTQKAGAKISKSKGGAEPIPGAAKRYGVDPMRLYYCHVGSPHVDIEWDPDIVLTYRQRVLRIGRIVDDILGPRTEAAGASGAGGQAPETPEAEAGPMDAWLEAAFAGALSTARKAYEASDLRTAATELVYSVPDHIRWYQRRGGANAALLARLVRDWSVAMCPILPHIAEEVHRRAGGEGLCSVAPFPAAWPEDPVALAAEEHVQAVLQDMQTILRLSGEQPSALRVYATPAWKRDLARKALAMATAAGGRLPVADFMKEVMSDPENRARGKEVQAFCSKMAQWVVQLTPAQRTLIDAGSDEAAILGAAATFFAAETSVPTVEACPAEEGPEHPKQRVAAPLKPGIALL